MIRCEVDLGGQWIDVPPDPRPWLTELARTTFYRDPDSQRLFLDTAARSTGLVRSQDVAVRLLHVPDHHMVMAVVDVFLHDAEGDPARTLPALITVTAAERGPRHHEEITLPNGAPAYRSVGGVPEAETDGAVHVLCYHALRLGGTDVVARTWLGTTPWGLTEVIGPLEAMLATLTITIEP